MGGATVSFKSANPLFGRRQSRTTDAITGAYTLAGVFDDNGGSVAIPVGPFTLSATHPKKATAIADGTFAVGSTIAIRDVMFANDSATVTVMFARGAVAPNSRVDIRQAGSGGFRTAGSTSVAGQLTIANLPVGAFTVRAFHPDNSSFWAEATGEILPGCGAVVRRGLTKVATYRDEDSVIHEMSAVCPHLGGIVAWNSSEHTWDCPCHGSRFDRFGSVVCGPAVGDLAQLNTDDLEENPVDAPVETVSPSSLTAADIARA